MNDKELEELKQKNINIYELLELPADSSENDIKKSYRKKALIYHPDKNPEVEAIEKFHLIKLALSVLLDSESRLKYDTWIKSRQKQRQRTDELANERKRMFDQLQKSETEAEHWNKRKATKSNDHYGGGIERLREEGMSLRRKLQQRRDGRFSVNKPSSINNNNTDHSVLIKWKHKQEIDLTCEILQSIMSVFGPVVSVSTIPSSSSSEKYQSSIVTFSDEQGYLKALSYDLDRDRSKLWENTSYRKLSGLLREIKEARRSDLYEVMIETLDRLKDYRSLS